MECLPAKCLQFFRQFFIFLLLFSSIFAWLPRSCPGRRFRRSASELEEIRGCDIIEGNLIFELIQEHNEANWVQHGNLSVTEVTGYVIFYDVQNLRSLDILLPNLSVIRGETLFDGEYALIIYLLSDLEGVNLHRLTTILHGSVYIYHCLGLSYLSTINFDFIVNSDLHKNYIQKDSPKPCSRNCTSGYCWTYNNCQNMCPNCPIRATGLEVTGAKCHKQCLGGCYTPNDSTSCIACRNFRYHETCLEGCENLLEWDRYKCVRDTECKDQNRFIYGNKCVPRCPWNYQPDVPYVDAIPTCYKSNTSIPCKGGSISSLESSDRFIGCKKINGSLVISLSGTAVDNIDEINKNLGQIEEVFGYVNIFDSEVRSLKFLNNLKLIRGDELLNDRSSFIVSNCKNLRSLWEPRGKFIVAEGNIQFYRNPKLCPDTIAHLVGSSSFRQQVMYNDENLKYILNGYEVSCRRKRIVVKTEPLSMKGVVRLILPQEMAPKDIKKLIGYSIYFKEARENITFRGKEDIDSSWVDQFVAYNNEVGRELWTQVENLKPATRYAFFVITVTVPAAVSYNTEIFYETTMPYNPFIPTNMKFLQDGKSVKISWNEPTTTYGNIDFYYIRIIPRQALLPNASKKYCNNESKDILLEKYLYAPIYYNRSIAVTPIKNGPNEHQNETSTKSEKTVDVLPTLEDHESKLSREELEIRLTNFIYYNQIFDERKRVQRSLTRYTGSNSSTKLYNPLTGKDDRYGDIFGLGPSQVNNYAILDFVNSLALDPSMHHLKSLEKMAPLMLKNIEDRIERENSIGKLSDAPKLTCTHIPSSGQHITGTEYTTGPLEGSRYLIEVRACHNMTDSEVHVLSTVNRTDKCWVCSAPFRRNLCIQYTDTDIRVQNVVLELLNSTAFRVKWQPPKLPIREEEIFSYTIFAGRNSSNVPFWTVSSYCANSTAREKVVVVNDPATYGVRVTAKLFCDQGERTFSDEKIIHLDIRNWSNGLNVYLPIITTVIILVIFGALIAWSINKIDGMNFKILNNFIYGTARPKWEHFFEKAKLPTEVIHPGKCLKLQMEILGTGNFGLVRRAELLTKDGIVHVAAKQLKEVGESSEELCEMLINEAKIMLQLKSHYLVQTHGLATYGYDLYLIMELMINGALSKFLEDRRQGKYKNVAEGSEEHLLRIALQMADGMSYLESKNIIHRDLAARNCLLDANFNAKISDFGMSRILNKGIYKIRNTQKVPLNRMPPEYFSRTGFTSKSDVWCYGIVLWELSMDRNAVPYGHLEEPEMEREIENGLTLSSTLPMSTPVYFITVANQCWKREPEQRPSFNQIFTTLLAHAKKFNMTAEFEAKSYIYCGELEKKHTYSAMSTVDSKFEDSELGVKTPLTFATEHDCNKDKEHVGVEKDHISATLKEKTRTRLLLIKQSIFFRKIFPFTVNQMQDDKVRKKFTTEDSIFRIL